MGIDYGSGVAPTVRSSTLRYVLARAARKHVVHGFDFSQAFMQSDLEKPAYIRMPHGYGGERGFAGAASALYGLKAAPKLFYNFATDLFRKLGFEICPTDGSPSATQTRRPCHRTTRGRRHLHLSID